MSQAKKTCNIVILPGDGIGPEVTAQAVRVLELVSKSRPELTLKLESHDFGGIAIDNHQVPLPDSTLEACKSADAILLGAVGGPKWGVGPVRPEQGLLGIRKALGLYANIRPANFASQALVEYSPLKPEIAKGVDMIVVRELIGGLYFGERKEAGEDGAAWDTMAYTKSEIERITRVAAQIALASNPPLPIHSIDKANVLACSRLWRKTVTDLIKEEYPQLTLDHTLVDSAAMVIVSAPRKLNGVILTENLFGDILSDESSVIPGSLGLLPSASLAGAPNPDAVIMGLYEPIHGSAPDIAGQNIANPIGTILSAAMMLRYSLAQPEAAALIEKAVERVLDAGHRTKDLGGSCGTTDMGDKICKALEELMA